MGRFLTSKIFIPVSHFRRGRQAAMRPIFEHYQSSLRFRREAANWKKKQKCAWILDALRRAVRRAGAETEYYAELFRSNGFDTAADFSFEDFARLPVLEREDIARAKRKIVSNAIPPSQLLKDASGGSTGAPTEIWLGPEERGWKESAIDFSFEQVGVSRGAKMAYFWGHHLDAQASDNWRDRLRNYAANTRWFDCFRLSPDVFRRYHDEFEKFAPDCIVAYASALGQFAEFLRENDIKPKNYPRVCFVTGAEKLYPEHRTAIETVFGKPVYERYGGRDFGGIAIQTAANENLEYEIDWTWALVEPETAADDSPILITKLHADGMPMLRYRTGDVGRFPAGGGSGEPVFKLRAVVGRDLDRIWTPDGKWIHGIELPHLLKDFAVREFAFIQAEDYSVELQIVPKPAFSEADRETIRQIVAANLQNLPVRLKTVEAIPRTQANKWRPVMSKVKR